MRRTTLIQFAAIALFTLFAIAIGVATRTTHPAPDFYGVVAQIIPVFLLVVAVDGGFFRPRHGPQTDIVVRRLLLWIPMTAEIAALAALTVGHDTLVSRGVVLSGLLLTMSLFVVFASNGPIHRRQDRERH